MSNKNVYIIAGPNGSGKATRNLDFGFESTLSGKSYLKHFEALRKKIIVCTYSFYGFQIHNWPLLE